MNKFHQIPTDSYVPISYDKKYLFDQYDRIANFLANNLDVNYKNILAKPVQNGQMVDWFSVFTNLQNVNSQVGTNAALTEYWLFNSKIANKIEQLSKLGDDNSPNLGANTEKSF